VVDSHYERLIYCWCYNAV